MKSLKILIFLTTGFLFTSFGPTPSVSFLILNGTIIDGLGNPSFKSDLIIRDGKMELIVPGSKVKAKETIDATGLIIAPGFIDVHSHTDQALLNPENRLNEGVIRQGITTIVGGPDGMLSPSRLNYMLGVYAKNGIGTNVAFYIGHNGIRGKVMKRDQQRDPTTEELNQMKKMVKEGMEMGAVGLSTGLMYEPGMYCQTQEVISLAKEVAPYSGIYDSHVRNPVHAFVASHREAIEIATQANIPGKLGHLKGVGLHNEGKIQEIIDMVEKFRKEGYEIVSDQYPYDGAATSILTSIVIIPSDMEEGKSFRRFVGKGNNAEAKKVLKLLLEDASKRSRIKQVSEQGEDGGFSWLKATGYTSMRITSSKDYPDLAGKYLSEIAEEKNMDPFESVCELILNAEDNVNITLGGIKEKDVQTLLVQSWNMIASDGAYVDPTKPNQGHPRSTGTFPRLLGHYVRELNLLSLEEAIRKITSFPADFIGLKDRGRIMDGLPADMVIFDPETIIDNSTYEQPALYASGVIHVFVNGVPVMQDSKMTGETSGQFLKRK